MTLEKEAQAVAALWQKAERLEADADRKTAQADDARWEAAGRAYNATEGATPRVALGKLATATAISSATISRMVRVWKWWAECPNSSDGRPTFWDAEELAKDATLRQRAASSGKSPTTTAIQERHAKAAAKTPAQARQVVEDKAARAGLKRAIRDVEADEDRAEAEAIRTRALADRDAAGRETLDPVLETSRFGANAALEAGVLIGKATRSIAEFIKLVHDRGPVPEMAREALLEELTDHQERVAWAIEALNNGIVNWDDALAKLAEG